MSLRGYGGIFTSQFSIGGRVGGVERDSDLVSHSLEPDFPARAARPDCPSQFTTGPVL